MPIASGRLRPGFFASPPACAIESKPMNEANSSADAGSRNVHARGDASTAAGIAPPVARQQRGGEVGVVEGEAGDDHHAAEHERQEHQRHHQSLVERDAAAG